MDNNEYNYDLEKVLQEKLLVLEREKELRDGLGYKYAHKFYKFQIDFIESKNKMNLLVAANQLGKSSSAIIRCCKHMFSTDEERIELWGDKYNPGKDMLLFWYFYPDFMTASTAFATTWQKYLPSGVYLTEKQLHERYGWKAYYAENRKISYIAFRGGILQFKAYGQSSLNLQSASCHEVFTDEELPFDHYSEIKSRMNYTNGYFNMVFTATIGQKEWYDAMERQGEPEELFPHAFKQNVSLWDCQQYEDGTPSIWTKQRIIAISNQYGTEEEVEKRVNGRFVVDKQTLVFSGFSNRNIITEFTLTDDYDIYAGVDIGSGGKNHKSAIVFVAVRKDKRHAVVFDAWREDVNPTPPDEVLRKFLSMRKIIGKEAYAFYDYSSTDFERLVQDNEVKMMYRAVKKPEEGIGILNALMKNNMLQFLNTGDVPKLFQEFRLVRNRQAKNGRRDDLCFTKGHYVLTNKGYKVIEDIKVGDVVLTRKGYRNVIYTMNREAFTDIYNIGGEFFECTPDHVFITPSGRIKAKNWKKEHGVYKINYEKSKNKILREILDLNLRVLEKNNGLAFKKVYNITVEGEHEYFINGILVSNCDSLRYSLCRVDFDFSGIDSDNLIHMDKYIPQKKEEPKSYYEERSLEAFKLTIKEAKSKKNEVMSVEDEYNEYNEVFDF